MNQFKSINGDEPTDISREWNSQPLAVNFKSWISTSKNSPMILSIMGRLNNHGVDNGDIEIYP